MDKATKKLIENAWKRFDRSTAYGCARRGEVFDLEACQFAWLRYNQVLNHNHQSTVPTTPIGL